LFQYKPKERPHAIEVTLAASLAPIGLGTASLIFGLVLQTLADPFFDELRNPATVLPNGQPLPELFDFTREGSGD
jgi:hypothetical protein